MRWIAVLGASIAGATLCGCFDSKLNACDNGAICPETLVCTERDETPCGTEPEVRACDNIADRTACSTTAFPIGTCQSGVCIDCVVDKVECRYREWKLMQSPTTQNLVALSVVAADDVYATGAREVVHYDGTAWSTLPSLPMGYVAKGVWASPAGDVVVVVQEGEVFQLAAGSWESLMPSANTGLQAIWGTGLDALFVVGIGGTILRYDGATWTPMTSNTTRSLAAIWGSTATNLVAVGAAGTIQQYNGSNWQAAPNTPLTGLSLMGVWTSGTRLVASGINSASLGITATKEAAAWNTQTASTMYLASVWGHADDDIFAVGAAGAIVHFDGATWTPMTSNTDKPLHAVAGAGTSVYAVGDVGTILRYGLP